MALAALGLAAAAATNSQQQGTGSGGMPEANAGSPTPSPGGAGTSGLLHKPICTRQSVVRVIVVSSYFTAFMHSLEACHPHSDTKLVCTLLASPVLTSSPADYWD